MKVIFLDIDGVMNSISTEIMKAMIDNDRSNAVRIGANTFIPDAVEALNQLMGSINNLWIVITSTWREYNSIFDIQRMFHLAGFKYPYRIFSITPLKPENNRSAQIMIWLRDNALTNEVNSFVIIDDKLIDGLLANYLAQTEFKKGLTKKNTSQIVDNFKNQEYRLSKIWRMIRNL